MDQPAKTRVELRVITSAKGYMSALTLTLKRHARNGDVAAFRAYVESEAFRQAFDGIDPRQRRSALRCFAEAEAMCEARAREPLVKPQRMGDVRNDWRDPAARARLAHAYTLVARSARSAKEADEAVARKLGITVGAARLARRRFLSADATLALPKAA